MSAYGVQIETHIHTVTHLHSMYEETVERAQALFLDGWRVSIGVSGKDSAAASVCVVEGLRRATGINPKHGGALHVVTTNTTLDNMVLHSYMMDLHSDLRDYGQEHGLPIFTHELKPSLSKSPMVEYVGKGKLLRTAKTSNNGRDCAIDWKIIPMQRFLRTLQKQYQTTKLVSISGSRDSESATRAANLSKRGESATQMVRTDLGWVQPIIKDWTLNDVWQLFKVIDDGDIESFSDRFDTMRKHYAAGNGGTCDLFAGDTKSTSKSCGSRFGCVTCAMVDNDTSLEAQIATDPKTYGFMAPLNKLREFMINSLYDPKYRSTEGRSMKDGFIKVAINHYSIEYRMDLLRYILSMQVDAYGRYGYHAIDLIDYEQLIAIQYYWAREGGEPEPGMAFKIWHEVVTTEEGYYPIPTIEKVEKDKALTTRYFNLQALIDNENPIGLDDEGLNSDFKDAKAQYVRNGEAQQVIRYQENQLFSVVTKKGLAMNFIEDFYPQLVEDGHLFNKCPTVMLKHMLEAGVVELPKGSIAKLHTDTKRSQALNILRWRSRKSLPDAIHAKSVTKNEMLKIIDLRSVEIMSETPLQGCLL